MWNEYIIDYNEENLKNNLVINHIKEHEYEIFLFSKGKRLANIIYSANKKINIDEIKALIYENFSFYMNLPLLSETSPLLQKLYYLIKDSSKETIKISNEEWDKKYLKQFNEEYNNLYDEINESYLENSINFPNEPIYDLEGNEIPKDKSEDKIIINKSLLLYINNDVDYDLSKEKDIIDDLEK